MKACFSMGYFLIKKKTTVPVIPVPGQAFWLSGRDVSRKNSDGVSSISRSSSLFFPLSDFPPLSTIWAPGTGYFCSKHIFIQRR